MPVWATIAITCLLSCLAFFLGRVFSQHEKLADAVNNLTVALEALKTWTVEHFTSKESFQREREELWERIREIKTGPN